MPKVINDIGQAIGINNQGKGLGQDDDGHVTMADPRVSRQFEVGVRKNWGDFVTTLNAFQIKRPGYWRGNTTSGTDFAARKNAGLAYSGSEQGMERSRGIEFNTYANLLNKTLRPTFGLMYLQSTVKDYPISPTIWLTVYKSPTRA